MNDSPQVYFDYNATAPARPGVGAAMADCLSRPGNPSSVHRSGRRARQALEAVRRLLAGTVAARPEEIVFTSGGTEANHLALRGAGAAAVAVCAVEHESVLEPARRLGLPHRVVPVAADGRLDLNALQEILQELPQPALAAVMLANNEVGTLQPVPEAAEIVHAAGGLLLCDAVQGLGKTDLDFGALGADLMTLSAHKIGGPQGVGALVVADDVRLQAQMLGGGQERGRRAGTENLPGIVGFGAALEASADRSWLPRVTALRQDLEARIQALGGVVQGRDAPRLPNTAAITMPGMAAETQVMAFDLAGFAVSAGAACSSGKVAPSHVLRAMGLAPEVAQETIRVSLGWDSSADEVVRFAEAWAAIARRAGDRQRRSAGTERAAAQRLAAS
ncbi:cysteine desulfurase family protein [Marinibaculum pumilum]|uniref:Cysteine desulfurase n=1 Tax=Marinibaculum pumilum TaxID=1766165 RepID=A0ABV7KWS8_9PROT